MNRRLRSGYTTGACAAAAAKAALLLYFRGTADESVEIPFPDGSRHRFVVHAAGRQGNRAHAAVIKDAGDDPDVTNGAEIVAAVEETAADQGDCVVLGERLLLCAGAGVGRVTKPGLAVPVGEPAINPIPRRMIAMAAAEAIPVGFAGRLRITIGVSDGGALAEKTLNHRLGIVGGLSILGTTGIVRPVSAEAWQATILASMDVARAAGLSEVVLSTGRSSERAVQTVLALPEEAYAMMGDYLAFSLRAAAEKGFGRIHLAGMWAKIVKAAMAIPQTHVRNGALEMADAVAFLRTLTDDDRLIAQLTGCNTAREIHGRLIAAGRDDLVAAVCSRAADYAASVSGLAVRVYLVDYGGRLLVTAGKGE
ncbi:MAG: cobalt-precorrin-5B (C(1))-methyltransferase CbiD [Thermodesulfobacteriota bacterium]